MAANDEDKAGFIAFRDTPNFTAADRERIESVLEPYNSLVVAAPNYVSHDVRLEKMPGARNALEVAFGKSAIDADANSASGFSVVVDGALPLDNEARIAHLLGGYNAGLATSLYQTKGDLSALQNEEQIRKMLDDARDKLPQLISPSFRNHLLRTQDDDGGNVFVISVTANDVAAARALRRWLHRQIKEGKPIDIHNLFESTEFKEMLEAAQCKRDQIAREYAGALKIELESPHAMHTTTHYSISRVDNMAHGVHQPRTPSPGTRAHDMYVVYNNTSNAAQARDGVLVSHGIIGGHTQFHSNVPKNYGTTKGSKEWTQKKYLSLMPADSARFDEGQSKVAARHRASGDRASVEAFNNRVNWQSDLGDHDHPLGDEKFNALADNFSAHWLGALNPADEPPLHQIHYKTVAAQLPDVSTHHLTTQQLGVLARDPKTPSSIPIAVDSDIVASIPRKWNTIHTAYEQALSNSKASSTSRQRGPKAKLGKIFDNAYESEHTDEMQVLTSGANAFCANTSHTHANKAALAPPATLINLDKRLIVLLTDEQK